MWCYSETRKPKHIKSISVERRLPAPLDCTNVFQCIPLSLLYSGNAGIVFLFSQLLPTSPLLSSPRPVCFINSCLRLKPIQLVCFLYGGGKVANQLGNRVGRICNPACDASMGLRTWPSTEEEILGRTYGCSEGVVGHDKLGAYEHKIQMCKR
jgi:hypothetical protein